MVAHSDIDHTGLTGIPAGGSGLEWTEVTAETVFSAATTAVTISRTLTPAIAALPADAVLATGNLILSVNAAAAANYIRLFHSDSANQVAATLRHTAVSGIFHETPFTCQVTHSTGRKLYYEVGRASGTVTYYLIVTGYWAPA